MSHLLIYLVVQSFLALTGTLLAVLLPGILLTQHFFKKMDPIRSFLVAYCVGVALFTAFGYFLGWVNLRPLSFILPLCSLGLGILFLKRLRQFGSQLFLSFRALPKYVLLLILAGVLIQSVQMVGNGLPGEDGMHFYRTNAYDGVFHIGLIEAMKTTFPPEEPSSSGLAVVNYHYWSDLFISDLSRTFFISPIFLFFQWQPALISLFTSLAVYELIKNFTEKEPASFQTVASICALLFLLLGSDSGWIFPLYLRGLFTFEYPAIDNGPTQFLNMPHVFGKLFLFVVGIVFLEWRRKKQISSLLTGLLLTAVVFGLKIYFGIFLALGYFFSLLADGVEILIRTKKYGIQNIKLLMPLFVSGVLFLCAFAAIYLPVNKNAGGLSWYPLEWPKLFINQEHFDWTTLRYKIAIAAYMHNQPKIIAYDIVLVIIGFVAVYGSRMFGFLLSKKTVGLAGVHGILFFFVPTVVFTAIGFTTLQVSGGFNVFNFFAVSMSFLVISLALLCAQLWKINKIYAFGLIVILLSVALPRSLFEIGSMLSRYKNSYDMVTISPVERDAFDRLRGFSIGQHESVATSLENSLESKSTYIRAFSGKPAYLAGKYVLETHNQPFQEKELLLRNLFAIGDTVSFQSMAATMNVRYIWIDLESATTPAEKMLLLSREKAVFANERIVIYDRENL